MSRWIAPFSVSETLILAHRVEGNNAPVLDINSDVLSWFEHSVGYEHGEIMLRFERGLVFDLESVEAIVQEMFPSARWATGTIEPNRLHRGAKIVLRGRRTAFEGHAETSACALLAALLRAYAATAAPDVARRAA